MGKFNFDIVKNPGIFQENRLAAHSDHIFRSPDGACGDNGDFRFSLNGVWKFAYAVNYDACKKDFYEDGVNCHHWGEIRVPAHIQMEGYDVPAYVNTQYPWDGRDEIRPGEIPEHFNPTASYVKYFTLPESLSGKPVYICFEGAESGMALWLNGEYVGYSEDSFTPSEFDLTAYVREGENKLAVQVFKWTAGSWCEDQDFFRFSGIFRDVYLYTLPEVHIRDLRITPELDDDYKDAKLTIAMEAAAVGHYALTLAYGGEDILASEGAFADHTELSFDIASPDKWSAETPNLYDLTITVSDEKGTVTEIITEKVGFRRFELINHVMCLNGKRIVFKGVDRHEFCSQTGRVLPESAIEKDIITMKRNNINAIRTSHYPNKSALYRLCDIYGIYVIDETNLETHGMWDALMSKQIEFDELVPGDRKEWEPLCLDRAKSMFERDKNHACILIWSCGNESFCGSVIHSMSRYFKSVDPTRLVHYEGVFWTRLTDYHRDEFESVSDMESVMYVPVDRVKEFLKDHRDKPFIECEYAHAMGNSCGAMHEYTEYAYEEELFQGGFIWDYIDQSLTLTDRFGTDYEGYGSDFGDRPCDYSFSGNGIAYGGEDRAPSPKMQEVKNCYQSLMVTVEDGQFAVFNQNLFTDASAYDAFVTLEKEGKVLCCEKMSLSVAPLAKEAFDLPFALPDGKDGEYVVTVSFALKEDTLWAKAGHEVAFGQGVFGTYPSAKAPALNASGKLTVVHGWHNIGVRGDEFEVLFSRIHGGLASYKYGGEHMLRTMPRPNFWRAMTENDNANLLPFRAGQWKIASMWPTVKFEHGRNMTAYTIEEKEDAVVVTYTYHLATKPAMDCTLSYEVKPDGTVGVTLTLPPSDAVGELPEISVLLGMDASFDRVKWYGLGPEETYPDRKHAKLSVYANKVKDNFAKYLVPGECGNKEDVRFAEITNRKGRGLRFTMDEPMGFSAMPYSPHELDCATHFTELPNPHFTFVRVGRQMGIAGDDTWGALTHPQYMIDNSKELTVRFSFKGI